MQISLPVFGSACPSIFKQKEVSSATETSTLTKMETPPPTLEITGFTSEKEQRGFTHRFKHSLHYKVGELVLLSGTISLFTTLPSSICYIIVPVT
eukprot:scaffold1625_cov192-Alexandrium_tamarense.AAC.17